MERKTKNKERIECDRPLGKMKKIKKKNKQMKADDRNENDFT